MAICSKCGSQVAEGIKFCGNCGSPVDSGSKAPGVPGAPPPASSSAGAGQGGMAPNVAALLVYVPFCFVGLVCAVLFGFVLEPYKQNRFIRFHVWQSLAVHAALLALSIGWMICAGILTIIHFPAVLVIPLNMLIGVGGLVLMIVLMLKAYGNQTYKLPVVGDWAEKQANK
jgi:uncharacterized membrane protein